MKWILKPFNDLSPQELYSILQLRNEVFAVEQNCVYRDCDDKDQPAFHLMAWEENKLVAYTRIIPPGIIYKEPSIGRVVTSPSKRRTGLGKELMTKSLEELQNLFGNLPVRIGAQVYLVRFYQEFGFETDGEIYDEDGIDHIEMVKS